MTVQHGVKLHRDFDRHAFAVAAQGPPWAGFRTVGRSLSRGSAEIRLDRLLARYLRSCRMDWRPALRAWESNLRWAAVFLDPFGIEFDRKNAARPGFPSAA